MNEKRRYFDVNIIDILVLLVLAFSLFAGMYKGFLASGLSLLGLVGSWFGALQLYPTVARLALENQSLMGVLSTYLEPETFFEGMQVTGVSAQTTISDLLARGSDAVNAVADHIGNQIPFLRDVFASNMNSEAFSALNINTIAEYFDQTLWQSVFGVLAFILCFAALYFLATLLVNLFNHVLRFPVLRKIDWLLGGIFGLVRGLVVAALILSVVEPVLTAFSVDLMNSLREGSTTYALLVGENAINFLNVPGTIQQIVQTGSELLT